MAVEFELRGEGWGVIAVCPKADCAVHAGRDDLRGRYKAGAFYG